jgi:hypothetical protein
MRRWKRYVAEPLAGPRANTGADAHACSDSNTDTDSDTNSDTDSTTSWRDNVHDFIGRRLTKVADGSGRHARDVHQQ